MAWLSPSRWGSAATATTVNLNVIQQPPGLVVTPGGKVVPPDSTAKSAVGGPAALPTDPLWAHEASVWLQDVGAMVLLGLLFSLLAWWRILRIKPGRRQ